MDTINRKAPRAVSKEEAIKYCFDNQDFYVRQFDSVADGLAQFENLICLLESDTIAVTALPDYGMSDQDLEL
jgi:hypothetical protein